MRALLVPIVAALVLAGCGSAHKAPVPEGGSGLRQGLEPGPPPERSLLDALAAVIERRAPERILTPGRTGDLADRLPLTRAAAQVLLAGFRGTVPRAPFFDVLRARDLGGVVLEARNDRSPEQLAALAGEVGVVAHDAAHVAPLVAARVDPDAGIHFASPGLARGSGIALLLGPSLDVAPDAESPRDIAAQGLATVRAWTGAGLSAAPAAFPGQGGATQDPLRGPANVGSSLAQLRVRDLVPFTFLLPHVGAVVVSNAAYAAWDGVTPATQLPAVVDGLLRKELHFRGVAIADDLLGASAATGKSVGAAAVGALKAGCDVLYLRDEPEVEEAYGAILGAVRRGELPEARLREAVRRMLALKHAAHVL